MTGHAEKAGHLLVEVNNELKAAAEAANASMKKKLKFAPFAHPSPFSRNACLSHEGWGPLSDILKYVIVKILRDTLA